MVVEFGRSCYTSEWRLFANDSSVKVRGRYYFSPPGMSHFPGMHNLGSRDWNDRNWGVEQTLGEDLAAKHGWNAGQLPAHVARNQYIGSLDCIERGGNTQRLPLDIIGGFPSECLGPDDTVPLWRDYSAYARCVIQEFYINLLSLLYEEEFAEFEALVSERMGVDVTVTVHNGTTILPRIATIIHPGFAIVVIDGTDNFQKAALQAFESVIGPTNIGSYSTLPFWYSTSQRALDFLAADGYVAGNPLMIAGHSMGAAVGLNLAARLRAGQPDLLIRYVTFGCPKIGDLRLQTLIRACEGYDISNEFDYVTLLPPNLSSLLPVFSLFPLLLLRDYLNWYGPPHRFLQRSSGPLQIREDALLDTEILTNMLTLIADGDPLGPIDDHRSGAYLTKTRKRCNIPLGPNTCATAYDFPIGEPIDVVLVDDEELWYQAEWDAAPGTRYFKITRAPGTFATLSVTIGCPPGHIPYTFMLNTDNCVSVFSATAKSVKYRYFGVGPCTIEWGMGACPPP